MDTPTDEQVKSYIDSVPGLRDEWGIPRAERLGSIFFVLMNALLVAVIAGTVAYFMLVDSQVAFKNVSGLVIVLALAYAVSALRMYQLRAERRDLVTYREVLAKALTGDPNSDVDVQSRVETVFRWNSLRFRTFARMIGLAGFVIISINTYQSGTIDFARMLLFDGAILIYLTGALWNNFAFKAELLEVELVERCRATIKWQTEHPHAAEQATRQMLDEGPQRGDSDDTGVEN